MLCLALPRAAASTVHCSTYGGCAAGQGSMSQAGEGEQCQEAQENGSWRLHAGQGIVMSGGSGFQRGGRRNGGNEAQRPARRTLRAVRAGVRWVRCGHDGSVQPSRRPWGSTPVSTSLGFSVRVTNLQV